MSNEVEIIHLDPRAGLKGAVEALVALPKRESLMSVSTRTADENQRQLEAWYRECQSKGGVQFVINFARTHGAGAGTSVTYRGDNFGGFEFIEIVETGSTVVVTVKRQGREPRIVMDDRDATKIMAIPGEWMIALADEDDRLNKIALQTAARNEAKRNADLAAAMTDDV